MIESPRNPFVVAAAKLHRRRNRSVETLAEGPAVVEAAADAGAVRRIFALKGDAAAQRASLMSGVPVTVVSPAVLGKVAATENPRGPVAVVEIPTAESVSDGDALVLCGVADPGNAGTMVRTGHAFGFQVVSIPGTVDLWSPKSLRAGAGAHFATRIGTIDSVRDLHRHTTVAAVVSGGEDPAVLRRPRGPERVALLVGEEAHGLPGALTAAAEVVVTIPMPGGGESLNAATAAGILMYERVRDGS